MLRKLTGFAVVAGLFISTPLHAEQYEVLVLPYAYFPQTSYVVAGDSLLFTNKSDHAVTIVSADGKWTTGLLGVDQSAAITVTSGMSKDFYHEGVMDANGDPAVTGILEFGRVPSN